MALITRRGFFGSLAALVAITTTPTDDVLPITIGGADIGVPMTRVTWLAPVEFEGWLELSGHDFNAHWDDKPTTETHARAKLRAKGPSLS